MFRRSTVRVYVEIPSFVMVDKQVEAHDLIEAGRLSKAVRVLRKQAGLSRREARDAVKTLRSGGVLPEWPMPDKPDLSARVADLKAAGRHKEALFLVRIEQQVSKPEAERFVDSV